MSTVSAASSIGGLEIDVLAMTSPSSDICMTSELEGA
jgi:hypothetical protein